MFDCQAVLTGLRVDVRLSVPTIRVATASSSMFDCQAVLCASMYGYQYPSWVQFPSCINVHLCCLACFTNVTCCLCCLTCFTNVDVQLSVPFLGPFPICFPNVTCSSCCLTCFTMFLVVVSCFTMLLVVVSAFGCIQTAGSTVVPNSKKMLPKGQLSPSPGRGPYAPDGVIGLTTEAYRIAFGR